jgi:hypothetical protein
MSSAYNETWVYNLAVIKEAKKWSKHGFIEKEQLTTIQQAYTVAFYHPIFTIRILLFIATLLASSGVTGFFALIIADAGKGSISLACLLYGIVSFFMLEKIFIANNHFKSGVTEAVLYHSCGFVIGGVAGLSEFNQHTILWTCLLVFAFAAFRYLDLLCTLATIGSFGSILFYEFYSLGGIFQQIIPFVFILTFTPLYFFIRVLQRNCNLKLWRNNLLIIESVSLLLIYAAGNYFVVRELSVALMGLAITEGEDIPFAFIFYVFTIFIPVAYLYFGLRKKNVVMLRVSLLVIAFSAFTFKYYFSLGHPEITLILAGITLIAISIGVMRYLKIMRNGFTRDNLLSEQWENMNIEAFLISQTMGGNQSAIAQSDMPGGGRCGGGASSDF